MKENLFENKVTIDYHKLFLADDPALAEHNIDLKDLLTGYQELYKSYQNSSTNNKEFDITALLQPSFNTKDQFIFQYLYIILQKLQLEYNAAEAKKYENPDLLNQWKFKMENLLDAISHLNNQYYSDKCLLPAGHDKRWLEYMQHVFVRLDFFVTTRTKENDPFPKHENIESPLRDYYQNALNKLEQDLVQNYLSLFDLHDKSQNGNPANLTIQGDIQEKINKDPNYNINSRIKNFINNVKDVPDPTHDITVFPTHDITVFQYLNIIFQRLQLEYNKAQKSTDKSALELWQFQVREMLNVIHIYNECIEGKKEALINFECNLRKKGATVCASNIDEIRETFKTLINDYKEKLVSNTVNIKSTSSQHYDARVKSRLMIKGYLRKNQASIDFGKNVACNSSWQDDYYKWFRIFDFNMLCGTIASKLNGKILPERMLDILKYNGAISELYDILYDEKDNEIYIFKTSAVAFLLHKLGLIEIEGCPEVLTKEHIENLDKLLESECKLNLKGNEIDTLLKSKSDQIKVEITANGVETVITKITDPKENEATKEDSEDTKEETKAHPYENISIYEEILLYEENPLPRKIPSHKHIILKEKTIKFERELIAVLFTAGVATSVFCGLYYGGLIVETDMIVQSFCGLSTNLSLVEVGALAIAVPVGAAVIAAIISGIARNMEYIAER